ncbi:Rrf2 family transcriptional regulator [Pseudonocardia parietis]|uniref:Rrf2 family protein n=1 Tax=Pseudonocardia parietis TaxID=570936 RepID=A0ABS4VZU4_9PSEU|nr:Rrf2 family transcriptional regulator [Pseudonocardia parietis]MBP2369481.1 Rrf2 family protein [Pseudonocardia parietis]
MSAPAPAAPARWTPDGTSRGTVVVLTGRGEHPGVYARLGRRLAFDGWTVAASSPGATGTDVAAVLDGATGARVLLGSDTGALLAWELAADGSVELDALVLAALPAAPPDPAPPRSHEDELDARTACPVHRGILEADPGFRWGALDEAPPPVPSAALPDVPVLWLHGDADPVAPAAAVRALARDTDDLAVVADGVHDVLNDQFHRIVAARLVQFLEKVAKGAAFVAPAAAAPAGGRRAAPLTVSARLDHALRALAELVAAGDGTVTCDAIARARGIPLNSLVNIMLQLRRAGLVTSRRGCEGGYRLARPADEITVADVVRATEGALAAIRDTGPAAVLWADLERTVADFLTGHTLTVLTPESTPR